ncbi:MAG: aldo/keto reductase [Planctomycetota bacterium]
MNHAQLSSESDFRGRDGLVMPSVGFGTYTIPADVVEGAVDLALSSGYRHVDTAADYGNEEGVGLAIQKHFERGLSREELFVTTKLWPGNSEWDQEPKTYASSIDACISSLEKLQLRYVDLYLIHAPFHPEQRLEQWRALVELREQGRVRAIGVSNFSARHIEEIRAAGFPLPAANQLELHPWSQKPELLRCLRENDILPIAYSSLLPLATWRSSPDQKSLKTNEMVAQAESDESPLVKLASKYRVSQAQVLLRWALQNGFAVLPKSVRDDRIRQNLDLFGFEIDELDMRAIESWDRGPGLAWPSGDPTLFA